jgi:hypothetical protein
MHFNLFGGGRTFEVKNDCPIEIRVTTGIARQKLAKINGVFVASRNSGSWLNEGIFTVPRYSHIELLAYSMPYDATGFGFKVKFDCRDTIPKLGVFYVYLNITSLEKLDVEPI